jgi:hypothetical protein
MMPVKYYWIALVVLLTVHSGVAVGGYHLFTWRTRLTLEGRMVAATAHEVQQSQQAPYGLTTCHLPLPVVLYVLFGYLALIIAAAIGIFALVRGQSGFGI